jgi:hypothetical protein
MTHFNPCPACDRHIRADEARCPFCRAETTPEFRALPPPARLQKRIGRGAAFLFRATTAAGVATTAVVACADEQGESSNMMPIYGAPAADAYGVAPPIEDVYVPGAGGRPPGAGGGPPGAGGDLPDVYVGPAADAYGVAADVYVPEDVYVGPAADAYGVAADVHAEEVQDEDGGAGGS